MTQPRSEGASATDWRAGRLQRIRALIRQAAPGAVEETKWKKPPNPAGVPMWSDHRIICTGETYNQKIKLTFAKGASLHDPHRLFNASLDGNARRAIAHPKEWCMPRLLLLTLLVVSFSASAIVIRDDVDDLKYRIPASEFPALVDMPGEGHGVLIDPQWVVTAAHAVTWQSQIKQVTINGMPRVVERLVIHPGYKKPPQELLDQALATWDWTLFRVLLSSSDDIALLKLAQPVIDVSPVAINKNDDEFGQTIKIMGEGATGNGVTGYEFSDSHRTELRRAYNKVTSADGRWLCYIFDKPSDALPLEGGTGSGDSGGPVLIQTENDWLLAGLTSWSDPQSAIRTPGRYGQISCNVRLSHYKDWIEGVISAQP